MAHFLTDNHYQDKEFDTIRDPVKRDEYGSFQLAFLKERGLASDARFLEFGCGDLRLGEKVIPYLREGWYFGADLNQRNLDRGAAHLAAKGIDMERAQLFRTTDTNLEPVPDGSIDMAFSNSVFSHLTLNTILLCLMSIAPKLRPGAAYYSTMILIPKGADFAAPCPWVQDGHHLQSFPARNPYHYTLPMAEAVAGLAGMTCGLCEGYGHPFQKMLRFEFAG